MIALLIRRSYPALLVLVALAALVPPATAAETPTPPGTAAGTGTSFETSDGAITIQAGNSITLWAESSPDVIVLLIQKDAQVASTAVTLGDLSPQTTYYKVQDNFHNAVTFQTDASGSHTYTQDLTRDHVVLLKTGPSTHYIPTDTTIGTWNATTRTYTLTSDVSETIQIDEDNLTLDGNGHTISGAVPGLWLEGRSNVTVKGLSFQDCKGGIYIHHSQSCVLSGNSTVNCRIGIYLQSSPGCTLTGNSARDGWLGLRIFNSGSSTLRNNTMSGNWRNFNLSGSSDVYDADVVNDIDTSNLVDGRPIWYVMNATGTTYDASTNAGVFYAINCSDITIRNLDLSRNTQGIFFYKTHDSIIENVRVTETMRGLHFRHSNRNTVQDCTLYHNADTAWAIYLWYSMTNTFTRNTLELNVGGIGLSESSDNLVFHNNFLANGYNGMNGYISNQAYVYGGARNRFHLDRPTGGNYWSDWTGPDNDGDGFVDVPYVFTGGQDDLPLTSIVSNQPPIPDAGSNVTILSTEQSSTTLTGTATDPDGDAMTARWLEGETVLVDWTALGSAGLDLELDDLEQLDLGSTTFTFEVSDGTETASATVVVTVQNSPPVAAPTGGGIYEYGASTSATLGGQVADYDGDSLSYEWRIGDDVLFSGTIATTKGGTPVDLPVKSLATTTLGLGVHTLVLAVDDGANDEVTASIEVEVVDTDAPTMSLSASSSILWPPNHEMQEIAITTEVSDNSGSSTLSVEVESDEPPEYDEDGNLIPSYEIVEIDQDTGVITLNLRAERSGKGDGRTYTIIVTATDGSGNTSTAEITITAPHDSRTK